MFKRLMSVVWRATRFDQIICPLTGLPCHQPDVCRKLREVRHG